MQIGGDGTPYRSYLYAADLAIWLWTLLLRGGSGAAYNVGSPHEISIADLARRVVEVVAPGAEIQIAKQAVAGQLAARYVPAADRAAGLGLLPWISLEDGVRRTRDWHRRAQTGDSRSDAIAAFAAGSSRYPLRTRSVPPPPRLLAQSFA